MKLEATGISYRYPKGTQQVLSQTDLTLESGQRLGLTAPSGRGKTTLCKILAGYERPDTGAVLLDGKPLSAYPGPCPVQLIWQHPESAVDPCMRMRATLREGAPEQRIVDELGIEPAWLDRFPGELSGGELQRFCVARALGKNTRFLLCDEITAMLDLITQSQLWQFLLRETARREIGMLVISHSPALLERVCTETRALFPGK